MVSMGYSVVVPIEVPPDIPDSFFFDLSSPKVDSFIDSVLKARNIRGVEDVVVLFMRNGKVISYDEGKFNRSLPAYDLQPVRGSGWTDREWNEIMFVWNLAYPRLKSIYGQPYCTSGFPPWEPHKVIISKDASLGTIKGIFIPSVSCWFDSKIKLRDWDAMYGQIWGPVLIHEMAHAFRNNKTLPYDQFEEGHARAVEVIVSTQIYEETGNFWDYVHLYHREKDWSVFSYGGFIFFQQWNTDFIGTRGNFSDHWDLETPRYDVSSFSWWKLWFRVPNYFRDFNAWLYSRWSASYTDAKNKTREIVGGTLLEDNLNFDNWWLRQYALRNNYFASPDDICLAFALGLIVLPQRKRDLRIDIFAYWRWTNGYVYQERPIPGRSVRVRVWNWNTGEKIKDTIIPFSTTKHRWFYIYGLPKGLYKVEAYILNEYNRTTCRHLLQERVVPLLGIDPRNLQDVLPELSFVAITTSHENGDIYILPPGSDYTARNWTVLYEWPIKRGRWTIQDGTHSDRWNLIIKDKATYYIYPGGWIKVPPIRPKDLRIVSADSLTHTIALSWAPNEEEDFSHYKWKWSLFGNPSISDSGITTSNSLSLSLGCGTYSITVWAYDMDGNESPPSEPVFVSFCESGDDSDPRLSSVGDDRGVSIKVYNTGGRLIYKGPEKGFKARKGIYFILKNGKLKKEVVR